MRSIVIFQELRVNALIEQSCIEPFQSDSGVHGLDEQRRCPHSRCKSERRVVVEHNGTVQRRTSQIPTGSSIRAIFRTPVEQGIGSFLGDGRCKIRAMRYDPVDFVATVAVAEDSESLGVGYALLL